jgi:hypothetical protein
VKLDLMAPVVGAMLRAGRAVSLKDTGKANDAEGIFAARNKAWQRAFAVGCKCRNSVTSCGLRIFAHKPADPVAPQTW